MKFDCLKTVKRDGQYYVGGKDQIDLPARGNPETDRLIKAGVISARPVDDAPEATGDETGGDETGGAETKADTSAQPQHTGGGRRGKRR